MSRSASDARPVGSRLLGAYKEWQTEPKAYFNMEAYEGASGTTLGGLFAGVALRGRAEQSHDWLDLD